MPLAFQRPLLRCSRCAAPPRGLIHAAARGDDQRGVVNRSGEALDQPVKLIGIAFLAAARITADVTLYHLAFSIWVMRS